MAVDASFHLELDFKRFLDRCPKLKSIPKFSNLLLKGSNITEEEVVHAVGELLLHPNYTIPLLGCFRPIAQKIVDRTVGLLRLVPNFKDDHHTEEYEEESFLKEDENVDSVEVANVIDVYVRRGKRLRLHELACLAFSRTIDLIPFLLGSILNYLNIAPPPFQRITQQESVSKALATGATQLLNIIRASYLFLTVEPEVFTSMWDWFSFLDIAHQPNDLTLINSAETKEIVDDIRWCSVRILSVVLKLSFRVSEDLNLDPDDALRSYLRWKEFRMDVSLEKGGWYLESYAEETELVVDGKAILEESPSKRCRLTSSPTSTLTQNKMPSYQIEKYRTWNSGNPFVLTSAVAKSFEMVTLAVSQRWPVLLYGPSGAGKTALIHKLSSGHGSRVLSIHMDEQIDGKTLIGNYVSTEQPGEFRWQPGSLTQAVLNGFWVVFEDVDKAPPDIISVLLPLLDGAPTFSTGLGEAVRVNEGFRLFSTMTSSTSDISLFTGGRSSLGSIWRKVMIGPPSREDMLSILLAWYPELKSLDQKLIETFEKVNQLTRSQFGLTTPSGYNDRFSLRDLLKLCKRVASLGFSLDQRLSSYAYSSIYKEAIDVFASFSTSAVNRLVIMKEIGKIWSVSDVDTLYPVNKPIIQESQSGFQVGRVSLQRAEMAFNPHQKSKPFVQLKSSAHALERIACSVKFNEPVLLVGETGTGKTTLVQTLGSGLQIMEQVVGKQSSRQIIPIVGMGGIGKTTLAKSTYENQVIVEHFDARAWVSISQEYSSRQILLKTFVSCKTWKGLVFSYVPG